MSKIDGSSSTWLLIASHAHSDAPDASHAHSNAADRRLCAREGLRCEPVVQEYRLRGVVPPTGADRCVSSTLLQTGLSLATRSSDDFGGKKQCLLSSPKV